MHVNASLRSTLRALILSLFAALFVACSSTHAPEPDASSADAGAVMFAQDACARALLAFELVDTCASSAFVCPWDAEGPPVELDSFEACLDALEESATCDEATLALATCGAR